jgi:hypothetical protein
VREGWVRRWMRWIPEWIQRIIGRERRRGDLVGARRQLARRLEPPLP